MIEMPNGCPQFDVRDCDGEVNRVLAIELGSVNSSLREWFDEQIKVFGGFDHKPNSANKYRFFSEQGEGDTRTARLIGIRPIVKDTAESVLREWIEYEGRTLKTGTSFQKLLAKTWRVLGDET